MATKSKKNEIKKKEREKKKLVNFKNSDFFSKKRMKDFMIEIVRFN